MDGNERIGKPEWLDDPRFESNPMRVANREALIPMIEEVFSHKGCDEWTEIFVEAAIPAGPVNNMEHLFADPQVLHRNMIAEVPHPSIGNLRLCGVPIKYSETPGTVRLHPPLLGEHTSEVLADVLGLAPEVIEVLKERGGIAL